MTTEKLPFEEWLQTLPRKRLTAGALLDCEGRFLIVKPNYRDFWILPGGGADALESPLQTLQRELREELGLEITPTRLLVLDYQLIPPGTHIHHEKLDYLFYAPLTVAQLNTITLQADELTDKKLIAPSEFATYLPHWQAKRSHTALQALAEGRTIYAQEGQAVL